MTWRNFQFWRQMGLFKIPLRLLSKKLKTPSTLQEVSIFFPWATHNTKAARELVKKIMCHYVELRHKTMQMFTENHQPANRRETPCCLGMSKVHHRAHKKPFFCIIPCLFTYLHTSCSRVFLAKLIGSQLVKKFPVFYGTRKFITTFTMTLYLSLDQSSPRSHPISWRSVVTLPSQPRLGLPKWSFPQISPPKPCIQLSSPPYVPHVPPIAFFSPWSPEQYWVKSTDH